MRLIRLWAVALLAWGVSNPAIPAQMKHFALFDGKRAASVVCAPHEAVPVCKATQLLGSDLAKLTGQKARVLSTLEPDSQPAVLVGLASDPVIASLLKANKIDTAPIARKWEVYGRAALTDPNNPHRPVLVIFGSDVRGTIWGVIDLSREIGISPWEWWADVTPRRASHLSVPGELRYSKEPTVKYRGIFLNDEDWGLLPWAKKTLDPKLGDIGPKTYDRIFELMWRLKANTIWPAMHPVTTPFDAVAGNTEMAASYAIIHASSHAEPLLRANEREWDSKVRGPFNYLTNKDSLLRYWDEIVQKKGKFENLYSVGLRGTGDGPMEGAATPQQAAVVLSDVIADQRRILVKRLGKSADQIPQTLTPYKEVLLAYDAGVKLPDDITITWPDDNHGYIRRLSNAAERARSGGSGVYYHISYWGAPMSYLWLATTHPSLLWEEMDKAYRFNARRIWIVNVGDIKPGEYLTQLFLDMAFADDRFPSIESARAHLMAWMTSVFGTEHAPEITDIMWKYYDLAFTRRPEFMGWNEIYPNRRLRPSEFSIDDFGDQNAARQRAYEDLVARVRVLAGRMPQDRKDAFFELVQYPVEGAAALNSRVLNTDKALVYSRQHRASANEYAARAAIAQMNIEQATTYYNSSLAKGKWRHIMDAAPQGLDQFLPQPQPSWKPASAPSCGLEAEGGDFPVDGVQPAVLPGFIRGLQRTRFVDVFAKAPVDISWTAKANAPWIKLDRTAGHLAAGASEARINVSIDWNTAPQNTTGRLEVVCGTGKPLIVRLTVTSSSSEASFTEENRVVSILASHTDQRSAGWEDLPGLGQSSNSLRSLLTTPSIATPIPAALEKAPRLTYRFATTTEEDPATLRVIALPTAPITSENGLRIAISIDNREPSIIDLASEEFSEVWRQDVLSNTAVATMPNLKLAKGTHTLAISALDPGIVLDRIELRFAGASKGYGVIPETRLDLH